MRQRSLLCATLVFACLPLAMAADAQTKATAPRLSAAEIVDKNVTARGGLTAWRAVKTLELKGKLDAGGNERAGMPVPDLSKGTMVLPKRPKEQAQLPFLMDLERGRKQRLEIQFKGQTALQVYNGTQGWKLRPQLNRHQVENFSIEELKTASTWTDLDGLLIDYAAKGEKIALEGVEKVEGKNAYNLKVTDKNGYTRHVWIDDQSFLEVKVEGTPRSLDGKEHAVAVYMRDYRPVNGLMMPYVQETTVDGVRDSEKMVFDEIVLNPKLDESRFAMPR